MDESGQQRTMPSTKVTDGDGQRTRGRSPWRPASVKKVFFQPMKTHLCIAGIVIVQRARTAL